MRPLAVLLSLSLATPASAGYPVVSYSYPSYPVYQAPQVIYRDRVRVKYVEVPVATYVPVQVPVYSAGAAPTYVAPLVPAPAPPPQPVAAPVQAPVQAQQAYAPAPAAQAYAQSPAPYRAHGGCQQNDAVLQALAALARRLDRVERPGAPPSPGAPPAQPAPAPQPAPEDPFNPAPAPAAPPQPPAAPPQGLSVMQGRCAQCHTTGRLDPGTGLSLFNEGGTALSLGGRELTKALKAVADGSMPPAPQPPLSEAERKALADYLTLTALPPGRDI